MNKREIYKQTLENHEQGKYAFEHWENNRFFPSYFMTSEDIKNLRAEYKTILAQNEKNYKLSERAIVKHTEHGTILQSYYTDVCGILDGTFYKIWKGYSQKTLEHINTYRRKNNLPTLSKYDWVMMPDYQTIVNEETGELIYEQ